MVVVWMRKGVDGESERCVLSSASVSVDSEGQRVKASLLGDVVVVRPRRMDDAVWKIGGSPVLLRLVELSTVSAIYPS